MHQSTRGGACLPRWGERSEDLPAGHADQLQLYARLPDERLHQGDVRGGGQVGRSAHDVLA